MLSVAPQLTGPLLMARHARLERAAGVDETYVR
jgi:hypothetical protein